MSDGRNWKARTIAVAAVYLFAVAAQAMTARAPALWSGIFQHLYFLPVAMAGLWFGWRGGGLAALAASGAFLGRPLEELTQQSAVYFAEAVDFILVGLITGWMGDREAATRRTMEGTLSELKRVHAELESSIDQVKRSERLSAVGELAAGIAHELRNPIGSLQGAVGLLRAEKTGEGHKRECLDILWKESERMKGLLSSLLDFARPRQPDYRVVPWRELLESVKALTTPTAQQNQVEIEIEASGHGPSVQCDPEQIKQVLLNLTLNAIQAMPAGGRLTLRSEVKDGWLECMVEDEGSGVAAGDLGRIFDPFFTTKAEGTGLGLPVAQQIAARHGGRLVARQRTPRGMVFELRIPVKRESRT